MEKKYQIFISSTYEDLIEERKKVQDTILSMYQFPIGMEMFSAADEEQWEIIQETIDSSDYYVLIIGHRYGSVIGNGEYAGISYTQKEFRYALEKKIPVLAFLIADSVAVIPDKMEKDKDKEAKLQDFINEVKNGRTVEWWTSPEDLANKVMNAINKQISRGKRPGWVRADKFDVDGTQIELVEMSRKIRRLENENEELKSQLTVRKPDLRLEINDSERLEVPYIEYSTNMIDCEYMELSIDEIPYELKGIITQDMVDEYNSALPSNDILNEFKSKWRFCQQAQENPFNISFTISNEGNMKAKDIYLEIEFPNEIVLFEKNAEIPQVEWPQKRENPIDKYYNGKNACKTSTATAQTKFSRVSKLFDINSIPLGNAPEKCIYNDDNSLSIRMEDLMTDYTWSTGENYFIVPKEKGTFEIVCSFVCEEYEKSITQIIQVVVK